MKSLFFLSIIGVMGGTLTSALGPARTTQNTTVEEQVPPKKDCRPGHPGLRTTERKIDLCGNPNSDDDRCVFSCLSGGFYHGHCSSAKECFCYRNNPDKGFIIERKQPVMRKVRTKDGQEKEITITSEDYTTGYVDVDVQLNLEWDLSYINEWFQSFNFYSKMECDPCLCPAGCALYGYFSGYCTPKPNSECMCATVSRKPK